MNTNELSLTAASTELLLTLAHDAANWSGNPLVDVDPAGRGNLTDLKVKGLLTTFEDRGDAFAIFTEAGIALALELDPTLTADCFVN